MVAGRAPGTGGAGAAGRRSRPRGRGHHRHGERTRPSARRPGVVRIEGNRRPPGLGARHMPSSCSTNPWTCRGRRHRCDRDLLPARQRPTRCDASGRCPPPDSAAAISATPIPHHRRASSPPSATAAPGSRASRRTPASSTSPTGRTAACTASTPAHGRVERVGQLPTKPGESLLGVATDSAGNVYVGAPQTGIIYRIDAEPTGRRRLQAAQGRGGVRIGRGGSQRARLRRQRAPLDLGRRRKRGVPRGPEGRHRRRCSPRATPWCRTTPRCRCAST